jgi:hypothetical protein
MVLVSNYFLRESKEGNTFVALELTGDLELIQSFKTGRFYASAKRCCISSVFSEDVAKTLIGKQLPGTIQRVECEPYEYKIEKTGEIMLLSHTYTYVPDEQQPQTATAKPAVVA